MKNFLAVEKKIEDIFGTVAPVGPFKNVDPMVDFSNLISFFLRSVMLAGGGMMLIYMLWGGLEWITSGGEKEKISKAQSKITNAILGIFILLAVFVVFGLLTGDILGIIKNNADGSGWGFSLPTL